MFCVENENGKSLYAENDIKLRRENEVKYITLKVA